MSHTTPVYALPYPDQADTADVPRDMQALAQRVEAVLPGVGGPTGSGIDWFSPGAPPAGYLLCDGSAVSRATYSKLFGVIGSTWGGGDGINTFNLPDCRGRVLVCAMPGGNAEVNAVGANDGTAAGSRRVRHAHTSGLSASHNITAGHNLSLPDHGHTANVGTFAAAYGSENTWYSDRGGASLGVGSPTSYPAINGGVQIYGGVSVAGSIGVSGGTADGPSYCVAQKAIRT
jgi:microcystin-dependent protein